MIVILMGVTGVGKTTVGRALAAELNWRFADADDYHSAANIAKMRDGIALEDAARAPWLQALHDAIEGWLKGGESVVLACSALKVAYRDVLIISAEVKLVYLRASFSFVAQNLSGRHGHYMNPTLLRSQFDTLEEPVNATIIQADKAVRDIVREIRNALRV
jgi:gluconokinase